MRWMRCTLGSCFRRRRLYGEEYEALCELNIYGFRSGRPLAEQKLGASSGFSVLSTLIRAPGRWLGDPASLKEKREGEGRPIRMGNVLEAGSSSSRFLLYHGIDKSCMNPGSTFVRKSGASSGESGKNGVCPNGGNQVRFEVLKFVLKEALPVFLCAT